MEISEAQRDMRSAFLGGFMGQLVSAGLWLGSAVLGEWGSPARAIVFLVVGGVLIFPLTQLGLRAIGRAGRAQPDNPFNALGAQVAFTLPLSLPVVGAATLYRLDWFFPSFMVVLGAHYLPFVTLYGMKMFAVLAGVLWTVGVALALWIEAPFTAGAWLTGAVLLVFAWLGSVTVRREEAQPIPAGEA